MTPESLIASASINIGLAIVIICLFSVLRKHHANANIYYSRRIGLGISVAYEGSYRRFLPSFEWIRDAVKVTEDDILTNCGLDALVVVRYFKLGLVMIYIIFRFLCLDIIVEFVYVIFTFFKSFRQDFTMVISNYIIIEFTH